MLVLHYTGMQSGGAAVERLCDPAAKVSAHYVVMEDGAILELVPELLRAWHAGASGWAGRQRLNDVSIGIEIVNPGHDWGLRPYPEAQMLAVIGLCRDIARRHAIPPARVLGHSDVAPARKADPGELFDWHRLAAHGLGLVLAPDEPIEGGPIEVGPAREAEALRLLRAIGYMPEQAGTSTTHVVTAFQRHHRQAKVDGRLDDDTMGRITALAGKLAAA